MIHTRTAPSGSNTTKSAQVERIEPSANRPSASTWVRLPTSCRRVPRRRDARAVNTRQLYRSVWLARSAWCADRGDVAMPADPRAVAPYLTERIEQAPRPPPFARHARPSAPSTVTRVPMVLRPPKVVRRVITGLGRQAAGRRRGRRRGSPPPPGRRQPARITGHSGRVGLASDLTARGAATTETMLAGGWKTTRMVAPHLRPPVPSRVPSPSTVTGGTRGGRYWRMCALLAVARTAPAALPAIRYSR